MQYEFDGLGEHSPEWVEYKRKLGFKLFELKDEAGTSNCLKELWDAVDKTQTINEPVLHNRTEILGYYEIAAGLHNDNMDGNVVQLGIYRGGTACAMALGLRDAKIETPLVCVDNFTWHKPHETTDDIIVGQKHLIEELKLQPLVVSIWHESASYFAKFWNFPIRFAFIDTGHSYNQTTAEIKAIAPHIVPGGWMVFHDYKPMFGAPRAIHEWLMSINCQEYNLRIIFGSAFIQFPRL